MDSKTFKVPNIGCNGCVRTIQNEVALVPGVKSVKADLPTKQVTVTYEGGTTWEAIKAKLVEIDYAPEEAKA
ncbi:MAG TPA: heavy-metal-associated domain-containing protein [Anaerolineae bacterium]|jgi:copper chaperone CopZ